MCTCDRPAAAKKVPSAHTRRAGHPEHPEKKISTPKTKAQAMRVSTFRSRVLDLQHARA